MLMVVSLPNLVRLDSLVSVGCEIERPWSEHQAAELKRVKETLPRRFPRLQLTANMVHFMCLKFCLGN